MIEVNGFFLYIIVLISLLTINYVVFIFDEWKVNLKYSLLALLLAPFSLLLGNIIYVIYTLIMVVINSCKSSNKVVNFRNLLLIIGVVGDTLTINVVSFFTYYVYLFGQPNNIIVTYDILVEFLLLILLYLIKPLVKQWMTRLNTWLTELRLLPKFLSLAGLVYLIVLSLVIVAEILRIEMKIEGIIVLIQIFVLVAALCIASAMWKYFNKISQIRLVQRDIKQQQEYLTLTLNDYRELKKLRHDYMNQLLSLEGVIDEGNLVEAKQLLAAMISRLPVADELLAYEQQLRLFPEGLKVLLITKLKLMNQLKLAVKLSVRANQLFLLNPQKLLDVITILGNLIDNAIDATRSLPNGRISIEIISLSSQVVEFKIMNTIAQAVNIEQLMTEGYTTKADHAGMGMMIVKGIVESSAAYSLEIEYTDDHVCFSLIVRGD